jgi:hypothetical protein
MWAHGEEVFPLIVLLSRTVIIGILVLSFSGCFFPRTSPFVDDSGNLMVAPTLTEDSKKAVIYFYRPPRFGLSGVSPAIVVSGRTALAVGRLHNSGYTWITAAPGTYTIKALLPQHLAGGPREITILVEEGQKYYIQVLLERYWFLLFSHDVFTVTPMIETEAMEEMKGTQYIRPQEDHVEAYCCSKSQY